MSLNFDLTDITFEQFEDILANTREAVLASLAENEREGGDPCSPNDIIKMFIDKLVDDIGSGNY